MFLPHTSRLFSTVSAGLILCCTTLIVAQSSSPTIDQELFRLSPEQLEQLGTPLTLKRLIDVQWLRVYLLNHHLEISRNKVLKLTRQKRDAPAKQKASFEERISDAMHVVELLDKETRLALAEQERILFLVSQRLDVGSQEDDAVTAYRKKIQERHHE